VDSETARKHLAESVRRDGYIPPCIPTRAYQAPVGPGWVHEIKHAGYRLQVRRVGDQVRLFNFEFRGYAREPLINMAMRAIAENRALKWWQFWK
jgi:ATP-dependent DNA ligase